ncbi:MAG: HAMP domain-containing sensor histidine kinase [Lachnospiraceae bacterium]|nr:HAMP domain-containing histidine kinase [Lachnospiraceae bacterium]MEE1343121.1 HAMP domain-containing sensor histidine kinase [Lachnospiraceae bacterium]
MKEWNRIFIIYSVLMGVLLVAGNMLLFTWEKKALTGREYRVEINRLAGEIEEKQVENVSLLNCEYVVSIVKLEKEADVYKQLSQAGDRDYLVKEIAGEYYRFDYERKQTVNQNQYLLLNGICLVCFVFGIVFLLYMRQNIIKPFSKLQDMPFQLAKGNLTMPLKEEKRRFFGRFIWGMDLLREHLEQQKIRELALEKEKKTFVLSLSHDTKTPLSAIKLYAKALSKGLYKDKSRQIEIAENINEKADEIEGYLSKIIQSQKEDFLDLPVEKGEFYLSHLMEAIGAFYQDKLEYLQVEFQQKAYQDCLLIGDEQRAIEVLQNMMENAIKYGDGRKIILESNLEEDCILVTVKNSGCTLELAEEPHVFDAFWRGHNSKRVQGSGLGLYICKELMHKMEGEMVARIEGDMMWVSAIFSLAN